MIRTDAENFEDYIQQSLNINDELIEEIESEAFNNTPFPKGRAELDISEAKVKDYNKQDSTVVLDIPYTAIHEDSDLRAYGQIIVRLNFAGRGKVSADLSLESILDISDDLRM